MTKVLNKIIFTPRHSADTSFKGFLKIDYQGMLIDSIAIHLNEEGLSLTYPAKELKTGDFRYYARPLGDELGKKIAKEVEEYLEEIDFFKA